MATTMIWDGGEYYRIDTPNGITHALGIYGGFETVEECRKRIDAENARRVKKYGETPFRCAIVKCTWNTCFYPDGTFYERNRKERMVELYPKDI